MITTQKEKFYDTIAGDFDKIVNYYDTNRRIEVIFEDFLDKEDIKNKTLLDGGCGTGWFSKRALEKGAIVTAIDISPNLTKITADRCPGITTKTGSILELPFPDNFFDIVISSDVIEHTPDPYKATIELFRVLKPGGKICITVPNRSFWFFSLKLAHFLRIRKYMGYENWVPFRKYKTFLQINGVSLIEYKGIHTFPFVVKALNKILYKLDKLLEKKAACIMVNIAAFGTKK